MNGANLVPRTSGQEKSTNKEHQETKSLETKKEKNKENGSKTLFVTEKLDPPNTPLPRGNINNENPSLQVTSKSEEKVLHPTNSSNYETHKYKDYLSEKNTPLVIASSALLEMRSNIESVKVDQSEKSTKKIDWKKYFSEHKSPKSLKYKPSQRKLWTSEKAASIMEYYCENKEKKKLLTMARELKKMFNFSCTFNTISHFILFILEETKNLSDLEKKPEEEDSSEDEQEEQAPSQGEPQTWEEYFKGKKPKSIAGKRSQEEIWEDGFGPKLMDFYYQQRDSKTLYVIAKLLKDMYGNYSVSTIKRFIDNVAKDSGERSLLFCNKLRNQHLKQDVKDTSKPVTSQPTNTNTQKEIEEKKKKPVPENEARVCVSCKASSSERWKTDSLGKFLCEKCSQNTQNIQISQTKSNVQTQNTQNQIHNSQNVDFSTMDWKAYFKFSIPKNLNAKQMEAIWNSGKGPKIMDYYFKNRDKKAISNIAMELKKMYHLTSSCPIIQNFIQGILEDVSKNNKLPDLDRDGDEDIQNINWDEYFLQEMPEAISKNPEFAKMWKDGTGKKIMCHFAENIEKETLGHILDELNARFKYPVNMIKQFIKDIINDLTHKGETKKKNGSKTELDKLSPKKRKLTEAALDKENTVPYDQQGFLGCGNFLTLADRKNQHETSSPYSRAQKRKKYTKKQI